MITIRAYTLADANILVTYFNELNPSEQITARELDSRLAVWQFTWTICIDDKPVGYARVAPLPSLPGQYDLAMLIAPTWQRQGLGRQLIAFLKQALVGSDIMNLSWGLVDSQSDIASFLSQNGFEAEHEELILARPDLDELPLPPEGRSLSLHSYPLHQTIPLFCRLYAESFWSHAWNQPYAQDEVAADLISARDILFLVKEKRPFGFAWLHIDENREGKVEPIGILPEGQRAGNGRFLFISALHELKQRGASRAIIGAWATNTAAITLYQSLGFNHQQTITYYAYPIQSSIQNHKS